MDYLADALHTLSLISVPRRNPSLDRSSFGDFLPAIREKGRDLEGRALYAFDLSALNAAADLRIDTPQRLERLTTAVLAEPRKIFLEANAGYLNAITQGLRGFFDPDDRPAGKSNMVWGAFVDILGDGKMKFQTIRLLPEGGILNFDLVGSYERSLRAMPAQVANHCRMAGRLSFDDDICDIDLHRRLGLTRAEFETALDRIVGDHDEIIGQARVRLEGASGVRERNRIIEMAWRAVRFRDLLRTTPDPDFDHRNEIFKTLASLQTLPGHPALHYGLPIIAMLALLEASSDDIRAEPRPKPRETRAERRARRAPRDLAPGLSVVTLNLADQGLQDIYESSSAASTAEPQAQSTGSGRARHPVRGHLFLARNGKMTWRKPHWRGSLEKPSIHRVIAKARAE